MPRARSGGAFDIREIPRRSPGPDEVEIAVEAASINPIDVCRAAGYARRLLSVMGASRFPMTLGNDFAGMVVAAGRGRSSALAIGERVYGVKPVSNDGTHASHVLVKAPYVCKTPAKNELQDLAALPYSFVTMWLAAAGAGSGVRTPGERRSSSMAQPAALECWLCRRCLIGEPKQPPSPKRRTLPPALRPVPRMRSPATTTRSQN